MSQSSKILFVSVNRHQRRYFRDLGEYLSREYNVFHTHHEVSNPLAFIKKAELNKDAPITDRDIQNIIEFMRLKGMYRKFSGVRKFLHSEEYLTVQAQSLISYFYRFIQGNRIDLVCVWNGSNYIPSTAAATLAQNMGIKTLFFENGFFPNTTTVDPKGVNYRSSLVGKGADFYLSVEVDQAKLQALLSSAPSVRRLKSKWYQGIFKNKPQGDPEKIQLPEKFVFLPFQVHDDTQILLHSPAIKTMEEFVDYVVPAVEEYNRATGDNLWVVAKEHPSDFGRVDYSLLTEKYRDAKVIFLRFYPTPQLIHQAKAVITVNSSVGIEALLRHKPVITLGNAFYNIPGIVKHVCSAGEMSEALRAVSAPARYELIDKFLYYLRFCYLTEGAWNNPDEVHFSSVRKKIEETLAR